MEEGAQGRKVVMYRDSDEVERAWYAVDRSELLTEVMKDAKEKDDAHMMGLYAVRRYDVGETITESMWGRILGNAMATVARRWSGRWRRAVGGM